MWKKHEFFRMVDFCIIFLFILMNSVYPLPQDYQVLEGNADITVSGSTMTINADSNTIVNFNSFDIASNESVLIFLPNATDSFLSNVIGGNMSNIWGNLECNGLFLLVNPAGIFIGPNAGINAANLVLSTRQISSENFLNQNYLFEKLDQDQIDRLIENQGSITIEDGGFGVLIAGSIENSGSIIVSAGTIALASGDAVQLDISGDGLVSVAVDSQTASSITNTGNLISDGGVVLLDAADVGDIFEAAINLEGVVRADTVEISSDGNVVITSDVTLDGDTTINNVVAHQEGTEFKFGAGHTIRFLGDVSIIGGTGYDGLTKFYSTQEGAVSCNSYCENLN